MEQVRITLGGGNFADELDVNQFELERIEFDPSTIYTVEWGHQDFIRDIKEAILEETGMIFELESNDGDEILTGTLHEAPRYEYAVTFLGEYINRSEGLHYCFKDAKAELNRLSDMHEDGLTILRAEKGRDFTHVLEKDRWHRFTTA